MQKRLLVVAIVLTSAILALGYGLAGNRADLWLGPVLSVVLGISWLAGAWRGWKWTPSVALVLATALAAYGLYRQAGAGWMLGGVVAALIAWDLDHFVRTMAGVDRVERQPDFERRHLQRLSTVAALGLMLGSIALLLRARLSLPLVVALGLLMVLSLNRAIGFLRREGD